MDAESNSLALIVKHIASNLRSRWTDFFTADGEKPDRQRDREFELEPDDTRAALMARWEAAWSCLLETLDRMTPEDLSRTVVIRAEPHTVTRAALRSLAHTAHHVGQIVLLAKHVSSDRWRSLSIPRGQSEQVNQMMREQFAREKRDLARLRCAAERPRHGKLSAMTRVVLLMAALSAVGLVQDRGPDAGLRARYTKQEFEIPMRDGVKLFTIVYAPIDTSRAVPDPDDPFAVRRSDPYGPDAYRRSLGPSPAYEKDGYIFVYQDVRGRFSSGGEFVEMRPHADVARADRRRREQRHLRHDRLAPDERSEPQRARRPVGHLLPRLLRRGRAAATRTPRSRPSRRRRRSPTCSWATTGTTTAPSCWRRTSASTRLLPRRERPDEPKDESPPFSYGTPGRLRVLPGARRAARRSASRCRRASPYWDDNLTHPNYDAFWQTRNRGRT